MLHPTSVRGDEGIGILVSLIRTFIAHGGSGIQFNIFDAGVLRDAQVHPEKYANLQVRVCGWNVRFTDLDPEAQETFIRQAEAIA
jgi:pyruvate-formate lyase